MIAALLAAALAAGPAPLECPRGTERRGAPPPEEHEEWCEGKDAAGNGVREGPARTWYDDGAPWIEQRFRAGLREGPYLERHRNGKVAREGAFAAGQKVGPWRLFYESGRPEEASEWRAGVAHGRFLAWWPGGARKIEGRHCGGAQCGIWRSFDEGGRLLGEARYGEQALAP